MRRPLWFFPALFLLIVNSNCGNSDLSKAQKIYKANVDIYKRAIQEPEINKAVSHLRQYLAEQPDEPTANILLWKCLIILRSPQKAAQKELLINFGNTIHAGIIEALADEDESVRQEAALLIGDMNITRAASKLIDILKNDEYFDVQKAAAQALARLQSNAAIDPLLEKLNSQNDQVRYYAAQALAAFKATRVASALLLRLKSPDETIDVRHQAAISLAKVCDQNDLSKLSEIFNDESQTVDSRILAASTLSILSENRGYEFILEIARENENIYYRGLAISALGHFDHPETFVVLQKAAKYGNKALRIRAADSLGEIGTQAAVAILKLLLEDNNSAVRKSAQNALRKIERQNRVSTFSYPNNIIRFNPSLTFEDRCMRQVTILYK